MPVSLPTLVALRFVKNNSLSERINVLQNSYKAQIMSFFSLSLFNMKEYFICKDINFFIANRHLLY